MASPAAVFDPETSGVAFDPEKSGVAFNPEAMGAAASPQETMQLLAPLVAKKDASESDTQAYKNAYAQYYDANSTVSRMGQTLKDVAGSATDIGGALWNLTKGTAKTLSNLPGASGYYVPSDGNPLNDVKAAGQGIAAGARGTYMLGQSLSEKAMEQIQNAVADTGLLPESRHEAAQIAVDRLKLNQRSAERNANPYNAQTQPQQAALFDTGSAGGSMLVPGVGEAGAAASKATQVAGDIIESGAYKTVGAMAKAVPPAVKAVELGGLAHAAIANPMKAVGGYLLDGPTKLLSKGQAFQSGLFQATNKAADVVMATPLGQSALDSVVNYSPTIIQQAKQDLLAVRTAAAKAVSDRAAAIAAGESTIFFDKTIKQLTKTEAAGNFHVNLLERGASMAKTMQSWGVAGMPSKLADATAAAVQGGLIGGMIAAGDAQPGDDSTIANGASKGAAYGGILSMLGTASATSQAKPGPSSFQTRVQQAQQQMQQAQSATYSSPIGPPTANSPWAQLQAATARLQAGKGGAGVANVRLKPQSSGIGALAGDVMVPENAPVSDLRKAANEKATNVFTDTSGTPHDVNELAHAIKTTAGGFIEAAKKEIPGQTYTLKIAQPREVTGANGERSWAMPAGGQASDQDLHALAAAHVPVSSKAFESVGYNPDKQLLGVHMKKKDGYQKYIFHEVSPADFKKFLAGEGQGGSMGKYFNTTLRNEWPYYHVMDPLYQPAPVPPVSGAATP